MGGASPKAPETAFWVKDWWNSYFKKLTQIQKYSLQFEQCPIMSYCELHNPLLTQEGYFEVRVFQKGKDMHSHCFLKKESLAEHFVILEYQHSFLKLRTATDSDSAILSKSPCIFILGAWFRTLIILSCVSNMHRSTHLSGNRIFGGLLLLVIVLDFAAVPFGTSLLSISFLTLLLSSLSSFVLTLVISLTFSSPCKDFGAPLTAGFSSVFLSDLDNSASGGDFRCKSVELLGAGEISWLLTTRGDFTLSCPELLKTPLTFWFLMPFCWLIFWNLAPNLDKATALAFLISLILRESLFFESKTNFWSPPSTGVCGSLGIP